MRVLLRTEEAAPEVRAPLVRVLLGLALPGRAVGSVQCEDLSQCDLAICKLVSPLAQPCRLFQGVGLRPFLVAVVERNTTVASLPTGERGIKGTGVQQASRLPLVHRDGRSLSPLRVT